MHFHFQYTVSFKKIIFLQDKYIKQKINSAPGIQLAFEHQVEGVIYEGTLFVDKKGNGIILWFLIPPLPDKTFWKFSDFHSENGLKSILTIIVMGNKQWFTSFCFQSWFPENEMLPDKTFWQRIQICIICWWSAALWWCILMSTGLYWTIFNQKSRITW